MARATCVQTHTSINIFKYCLLFTISGVGQAAKDPNSELQCFDADRNVTVGGARFCDAGCCVYKGEDGELDDDSNGDHSMTPYCGTEAECKMSMSMKSRRKYCTAPVCRRPKGAKSWLDPKSLTIACALLVIVAGTVRMRYKAMQKSKQRKIELEQREIDLRNKLDLEFPPVVYGNAEDLEVQNCESDVCCICLEGLEGTLVRKLHCSHVLHQNCFDRWCLHLSDPTRGRGLDQNVPAESLWACPFCKHPAIPEQVTGTVTGVEQEQAPSQPHAGSQNNRVVLEDA